MNKQTNMTQISSKIKIIIPINSSAYNEAVFNAAQEVVSNSNTQLAIENISSGGHDCIESSKHSKDNAPYTADLIQQAEKDGFDAVYVCDMDMCGIALAKKRGVKILLHGGFSSNLPIAADRGNFLIISVVEEVIEMQRHFVDLYGKGNCVGIYPTGLKVHQLHDDELVKNILFEKACYLLKKYKNNDIRSIVFGCSGFVNYAQTLTHLLQQNGYNDILVIDPNRTAIQVIKNQLIERAGNSPS